jgi:5'-methylthioadenosine phosphorylase
LAKVKVAIIGGTGFEELFRNAEQRKLKTPYGTASGLSVGKIDGRSVVFLPRHGSGHRVPPHRVNYRANVYALHKLGVERILATNAVGAINPDFRPGDVVIPHDFVDFTKLRCGTFYDKSPVTHVDVSEPYCPEMRLLLTKTAKDHVSRIWDKAVLVCTEGPRYETPAEIEMFRRLGCDVVGMTGCPEAALARELEMCYASICYVSNMAAGMQRGLTVSDVSQVSKKTLDSIEEILIRTVKALPVKRGGSCPCAHALTDARFQ